MAGQFGYLRSVLGSRVQDSYEFCHTQNATYYHRVDDPGACLAMRPSKAANTSVGACSIESMVPC